MAEEDEFTISINFWFSALPLLQHPTLPLSPMLRVELVRQLELLIPAALCCEARHVAAFFRGLRAQLELCLGESDDAGVRNGDAPTWCALDTERPAGIDRTAWAGLFEYVMCKMFLLLGAPGVLPFVRDLCDPLRFERLELI